MVESLQLAASIKLNAKLTKDKKAYASLIKDLLVQGLIKLIEPTVILRVRKSDLDVVKAQIDAAIKQYKEVMLKNVRAFKGKTDINCKVLIDEKNWLNEWNE